MTRNARKRLGSARSLAAVAVALVAVALVAVALVVAAPAPAWAQSAVVAPSEQLLRLGVGLAVIVGAIVLLSFVLKRTGRGWSGAARADFRVVASLPLGARERVVLLQAGEQQLLVGIAPGNVRLLHALDAPIAAPAPGDHDAGFHRRLLAAVGRGGGSGGGT